MRRKLQFYETYGVKEYLVIDPEKGKESFLVWERRGDRLVFIPGYYWRSSLLEIEIRKTDDRINVYHPNGSPFKTAEEIDKELIAERERAEAEKLSAEEERKRSIQLEEEIKRLKATLRDEGIED